MHSSETGAVSFTDDRAHFYKLVPGGGLPQEIVLDGPLHVHERERRGGAERLERQAVDEARHAEAPGVGCEERIPSELEHVRAVAYLADGVADPKRVGDDTVGGERMTHYRGPRRSGAASLRAHPPASARRCAAPCGTTISRSRSPPTSGSTTPGACAACASTTALPAAAAIVVDGRFSDFGTKVDLTVPPRRGRPGHHAVEGERMVEQAKLEEVGIGHLRP